MPARGGCRRHDAVEILFEVRVTVAVCVERTVAAVGRIEAVLVFPTSFGMPSWSVSQSAGRALQDSRPSRRRRPASRAARDARDAALVRGRAGRAFPRSRAGRGRRASARCSRRRPARLRTLRRPIASSTCDSKNGLSTRKSSIGSLRGRDDALERLVGVVAAFHHVACRLVSCGPKAWTRCRSGISTWNTRVAGPGL